MFGSCEACGRRFPVTSYFRLRNEFECAKCGTPYAGTFVRILTTVAAFIAGVAVFAALAQAGAVVIAALAGVVVILVLVAAVPGQFATARPGADTQRDD